MLRPNRDGRKQTYQYDANGNVTQEQWFDSSGNVVETLAFTYDADGNLLAASNVNGAYTFTYNGDGNIATMQGPFGVSLTYSYAEQQVSTEQQVSGTCQERVRNVSGTNGTAVLFEHFRGRRAAAARTANPGRIRASKKRRGGGMSRPAHVS